VLFYTQEHVSDLLFCNLHTTIRGLHTSIIISLANFVI